MTEKDYDYVVDVDRDGDVKIPEELKNSEGGKTVRQPSSTTVYRSESLQFYASSNDHLDVNMEYFEAEIKIWSEDKKYLIKAEFPEEMSDELQAKIQSHVNSGEQVQ